MPAIAPLARKRTRAWRPWNTGNCWKPEIKSSKNMKPRDVRVISTKKIISGRSMSMKKAILRFRRVRRRESSPAPLLVVGYAPSAALSRRFSPACPVRFYKSTVSIAATVLRNDRPEPYSKMGKRPAASSPQADEDAMLTENDSALFLPELGRR